VADGTNPGANPLDLINFVQAVREHKQDGIFIALVHGGAEYYSYPSPEMVRRSRFMIDMGADAVVCCHTHCPLPWETYAGRPIVYGLGNLVFEPLGPTRSSWHEGYLAQLQIEGNEVRFEPIPSTQSLASLGVTSMETLRSKEFLAELVQRNGDLKNSGVLEKKWTEFCERQRPEYLSMLFAYSPTMDRLRRILLPLLHPRREVQTSLLLAQCETHREVLETLFKEERLRG
jgi:hypothetical protein